MGNTLAHRCCRRVGPAVLAALLAWAPATSAMAESPKERAGELASRAASLARQDRLDEAIELFRTAYDLDPAPAILYNLGRLQERKGRLREARGFYERLLSVARDEELAGLGRERLEDVLGRLPGLLRMEVAPADARVLVDGRESPDRPEEGVPLPRGTHQVEVRRSGYESQARTVEILPDEVRREGFALRPLPGWLIVRSVGPVTEVTVDGAAVDPTPGARIELPAGSHDVKVGRAGQPAFARRVEIPPGGEATLALPLEALNVEALPRPPRSYAPWHWVTLGLGAAILATGGLMTGLAFRDADRVNSASTYPDGTVKTGSLTRTEALALKNSAEAKSNAGIALYAIGGASLVTGIVFWILEPRAKAGDRSLPTVSAAPVPGGGAVQFAGRF